MSGDKILVNETCNVNGASNSVWRAIIYCTATMEENINPRALQLLIYPEFQTKNEAFDVRHAFTKISRRERALALYYQFIT